VNEVVVVAQRGLVIELVVVLTGLIDDGGLIDGILETFLPLATDVMILLMMQSFTRQNCNLK